jgi:hypothetical protein
MKIFLAARTLPMRVLLFYVPIVQAMGFEIITIMMTATHVEDSLR